MAGYKLATYQTSDGARAGLVIDDKVYDAAKLTGEPDYASVLGILADWRAARGVLNKAAKAAGKSRRSLCRSRAPSCWRRCVGRRRSTAPAPIMPTMPPKWPAA